MQPSDSPTPPERSNEPAEIRQSDSIAKLAAALVAAQGKLKAVAKDGNNTFDKYTYATLENYVEVIRPVLAEHELCVICGGARMYAGSSRSTRSGGTEFITRVQLTVRIIHSSGEWLELAAFGEGQDRADKGIYKAITGARKYALACAFNLVTSDDPEDNGDAPPSDNRPSSRQTQLPSNKNGASRTQPTEPELSADDQAFKHDLDEAFREAGFDPSAADAVVAAALRKHKLKSISQLDAEQRKDFLKLVQDGKFDHLKTNKNGKAPAKASR